MKIGVFSTFMSPLATPQMIRAFGRRAEDMGLDSIWMGEHVALFDKNTFGYPGSKDETLGKPDRTGEVEAIVRALFLDATISKARRNRGISRHYAFIEQQAFRDDSATWAAFFEEDYVL